MLSAITTKGQATIPKPIREHLKLRPGDKVKFFIHPNGSVVMLPIRRLTDLEGSLKYEGPPVSIEEMDRAIAAETAERDRRSRE